MRPSAIIRNARTARSAALLVGAALLQLACAQQPAPQPQTPVTVAAKPPDLPEKDWKHFVSKRYGLAIPFSQLPTWSIDDQSSPWLVAKHGATGTTLHARVWYEAYPFTQRKCEARLRESAPALPLKSQLEIVDERKLSNVPSKGFEAIVWAGFRQSQVERGARVEGFAQLIAWSLRACVVVVFSTAAQGPAAAEAVGDRLPVGTFMLEQTVMRTALDTPPMVPHS